MIAVSGIGPFVVRANTQEFRLLSTFAVLMMEYNHGPWTEL